MIKFIKKFFKGDKRTAIESDIEISVIIPSYLGEYEGCASDRPRKLIRAVYSVLNQTLQKPFEIIIVSDGCFKTNILYDVNFIEHDNVHLVTIDKQKTFSGKVREEGLFHAKGNVIVYLDSDDMYGKNHLKTIYKFFENNPQIEWVYFNDYLYPPDHHPILKMVSLEHGSIGTSSIAHRNDNRISWFGCDGYGHDWKFIKTQLIDRLPHYVKISGADYRICHIPNQFDR